MSAAAGGQQQHQPVAPNSSSPTTNRIGSTGWISHLSAVIPSFGKSQSVENSSDARNGKTSTPNRHQSVPAPATSNEFTHRVGSWWGSMVGNIFGGEESAHVPGRHLHV